MLFTEHVWGSEDSFQEFVLYFHPGFWGSNLGDQAYTADTYRLSYPDLPGCYFK